MLEITVVRDVYQRLCSSISRLYVNLFLAEDPIHLFVSIKIVLFKGASFEIVNTSCKIVNKKLCTDGDVLDIDS